MSPTLFTSRSLAVLCIAQTVIFLIPIIVLGNAIGWPASLRLPAAEILPLISLHAGAVQFGYWAYLLVSVAMIPLAFAFRAFFMEHGIGGLWLDTATFTGAAAGVLKTLGIVRWLGAMPTLAETYGSATDPVLRQSLETVYLGLNTYGGSVGELLGVQLMSGLWLTMIGVFLIRAHHRILGAAGSLIGLTLLLLCMRTAIPAVAALQTVALSSALVWYVAMAVSTLRSSVK